jgi:hypothetical protein
VNRGVAVGALAFTAFLGACFNPTFDNPTCGPNGECPSGMSCEQTVCREIAGDVDAPGGGGDAIDSATDSGIDAPTDAFNDGAPNDGVVQCQAGDMPSPSDPSRCFRKLLTSQPWGGSRNNCQSLGGDLADIRNGQENQIAMNFAGGEAGLGVWIAGTDQAIEMEWRWVNTNMLVNSGPFIGWASGEPNGGGVDDCMRVDQQGNWYDTDCNTQPRRAICLMPAI